MSSRQDVRNAANQARLAFGDVDILINNAGIVQGKSFFEMDEKFVSKSIVINLESHFWLIKEFLEPMTKKNSG